MSLDELVAIARGARVALSDEAVARVESGREVVDGVLGGTELVYGLNTGLGHGRNDPLPARALRTLQPIIVAMHDGTMGDLLPTEVVRGAMAARLNGLARGGSGATVAAARSLESMLNAEVHPVLAESGSVGAADLGHMAAIAMVAMGSGRAELEGEEMDGGDALRIAGISPLEPEPKDGLAMISANGVTIGHGALALDRAARVLAAADAVAAVSLEAFGGNPSIVEATVAGAKGSRGQEESSARIRSLLAATTRCGGGRSVQDPLAFRVVPQVHGAARDMLAFAADALVRELNAQGDNPLVSTDEGRLISNGNFHPMLVALSMDALRPALAHVGQIADRRLGHLWDGFLSDALRVDPKEMLNPPPDWAGMLLRYAVAGHTTRLRQLADPVTLDVPPLDQGVEDHATNAPQSVQLTEEALGVLEDVLSVELLVAYKRLHEIDPRPRLGLGTTSVIAALGELLAGIPNGTPATSVQRETRLALTGALSPVMD